MISYHSLIILSLILALPCVNIAQNSSCDFQGNTQQVDLGKKLHVKVWETYSNLEDMMKQQMQLVTSIHQSPAADTQVTTNLGTWKGQNPSHFQHHLRNTHGILNIIGWGTLLPVGAITARYFRRYPLKCNEWHSVHITCQTGGYLVGAVGWCLGMLLGNSSKQQSSKTHRTLGIIIFTFTTIQMFAIFWRPKEDDQEEKGFPKCLKIYHQVLGYAVIALTIANIFEGMKNQGQSEKWKWGYVGILVVLGITALGLEIFTWIKSRIMHQAMELSSNMYTSP